MDLKNYIKEVLYLFLKYFNKIISWNVPYKVDMIQLKNLLLLEQFLLMESMFQKELNF